MTENTQKEARVGPFLKKQNIKAKAYRCRKYELMVYK